MKKYSDWLKIDLHLHTNLSKQTKENDYQGDFTVEVLYQKLKENNVEIFSLTDHNIINVTAYQEYYQNFNTDEDPILLIGVELDIEVSDGVSTKIYHSLLIFNYNTYDKANEINNKLEAKYTEKGLNNFDRKLNFEEIIELFHDDEFFFIPHADGHRNIVSAYSDVGVSEAQKMVLLMPSALEKVTNEERRRVYSQGFSQRLTASFKAQDDIPYIEFSDNHNISQYPKTHKGGSEAPIHNFYYVKGGKNYETLRLAFIDPKSRVMSSQQYDDIDKVINKIEKIKIENEQKIENNEIFFSPHLNVIIGGRSSGKSLLMNVLGKKIDRVDIKRHYKINNTNFLIKSKDDDNYKEKTSISDNLIYINQGDIVRYFEQNDLKSLAEKSEKIEDYYRAKESINVHKQKLEELIGDLVSAYEEVIDLGSHIKYELHQSAITNIFSKEYTLNLNEDELKEKHINSEKIAEAKLLEGDLYEKTREFKSNILYEFTVNENDIIDAFLLLLKKKKGLIDSKDKNDTKKLDFIQKVKILINDKNGTLSHGAQEKARSKEKLDFLKQNIKEKFQKVANLKRSSNEVEKFNYEIEKDIEVSDDIFLVLSVEKDREVKDIILDGIKNAEPLKSLYINFIGLTIQEKTLKSLPDNSVDRLKQKLDKQIGEIYQKFNKPKDYLRYADNTTSKENSPGLNSENYLKVILKNGSSKMIFIDQPEDNLGNRFISDELVDIIREIKFQKQIFLVTHNPAIAVYGDAECIIIAENNDNKISYKQIVLEDKDAQKEICSILDGGEYIFDNRSRKYNIQRILRESQNG